MVNDDPEKMARMRAWLAAVSAQLELPAEVMTSVETPLLDLIATVAHGPSRPGAPLTAFLVGYAAGKGGDATALIADVQALADAHTPTN